MEFFFEDSGPSYMLLKFHGPRGMVQKRGEKLDGGGRLLDVAVRDIG